MGPIARLLARLSGTPDPACAAEDRVQGEALARVLERYPGFRVLRAIDHAREVDQLGSCDAGEKIAVVVDTETTGLDPLEDRLIEIAVQRFRYSADGQVREVEQVRSWLEDPERPLPERIAKLTGLTDQELAGRRFDTAAITSMLSTADLVIAHNAAFDRPFLDRRFLNLRYRAWACSMAQVDWLALGFDGRALGHLVLQSGRFFEGHRAGNDVAALTSLLATPAIDRRTILSHLLARCMLDSFRVDAVNAPFEAKDALKKRGYRWDPSCHFWWREVEESEIADETGWLDRQVYSGSGKAKIQRVTPSERFAPRAQRYSATLYNGGFQVRQEIN